MNLPSTASPTPPEHAPDPPAPTPSRTTDPGAPDPTRPYIPAVPRPATAGRLRRINAAAVRALRTVTRLRPGGGPARPARDVAVRALRRTDAALLGLPADHDPDTAWYAAPGTARPLLRR